MHIHLYDKETINTLVWPQTADALYSKSCLVPFVTNGTSAYINNIKLECMLLQVGDIVLPLMVSSSYAENSWVCSPTAQYIEYAQEYTTLVPNKLLAKAIRRSLKGMGRLAKASKLNAVVYVNNWLFAVDLYPPGLTQEHLLVIKTFLQKHFPESAIIFRSLNPILHARMIQEFKTCGFKMLISRYIHITDAKEESIFRTRILKSDLRLLEKTSFTISDESFLSEIEQKDILNLYQSLYITQHSSRNPQINERYMHLLVKNQLLHFKIVRKDGQIKGVAGYLERNGILLCPFFGYEKNHDDRTEIYRLLSTSLLLEAKKKGLIFHQSAGASFYKKVRRARGCYEYNATFTDHLPFKQRFGWSVLRTFINTVAPPFMKKY